VRCNADAQDLPLGGELKCVGPYGGLSGEINESRYKGRAAARGFSPAAAARHSKFGIWVGTFSHCMGVLGFPQGGFCLCFQVLALFWIPPLSTPKNTFFWKIFALIRREKSFPSRVVTVGCEKMKESENDGIMYVYTDYFFDPFDDQSPQNKTTREEEEKKRPNWRRLKRPSVQVAVCGGGVVRRVSGGWYSCP